MPPFETSAAKLIRYERLYKLNIINRNENKNGKFNITKKLYPVKFG